MGLRDGMTYGFVVEAGAWMRFVLVALVTCLAVVGVHHVYCHARGATRACETRYEARQERARDLLENHCAKEGYGQSEHCVIAFASLQEDKEHFVLDCVASEHVRHLPGGVNPWMVSHFLQEVSNLSMKTVLVLGFLALVWFNCFSSVWRRAAEIRADRHAAWESSLPRYAKSKEPFCPEGMWEPPCKVE